MSSRKSFQATALLAAVLFVLGAYLIFLEIPRLKKERAAEEKADRFFDFDGSDIQAMVLRYPSGEIQLDKSPDEKWVLTRPVNTEADQREVESLVSTVSDVRTSRIVEDPLTDPAEFGLAVPNTEIMLTLPDRSEKLLIGDNGPMSGTVYIMRESDRRVALAQQWIRGSLFKSVFDLRSKVVLPVDQARVTSLRLEFPKLDILLGREGDDWTIQKPSPVKADGDAVRSLTLMMENLRANQVMDPGAETRALKKSFKHPLVSVTLTQGTDTGTARFFDSPDKQNVYVLADSEGPVFRVARATLDELKPFFFHYRDKHLLSFQPESIQQVAVRTPAESYTLIRRGDDWSMEGEEGGVIAERAKRFFNRLTELKAHQEPDPPVPTLDAAGLKPPRIEIRMFDSLQSVRAALQMGKEWKGMLYTRGNTGMGTVLVNKDFLDDIPRRDELIRKEEPKLEAPPTERTNP